ncbi:MAG: hypothetical protein M3512_07200 [Bacteroidota bacterium]|nr:hypothetical protein [Bacteroidota bacterium]
MNLLIYIEINELHQLSFKKQLVSRAKDQLHELTIIDFDNFSDSYLIDSILKMVREAEKVAIIVDVQSAEVGLGGVVKFFNSLIRANKEKVMIIFNGKNDMLFKMVQVQNHKINLGLEEQVKNLKEFFKA